MSFVPRSRSIGTAVAIATAAMFGCDGCTLPGQAPTPPSPDDIIGQWTVDSYAFDDDGCQPGEDTPPYQMLVAADGDDDDELTFRMCPSPDHCPERVAPENVLTWDDELHRAEATYFTAAAVDSPPEQHRCRLSKVQTLVDVDNSRLELTRGYYQLTLPLEGDTDCTAEVAESYSGQMPCYQSETAGLVAAEPSE